LPRQRTLWLYLTRHTQLGQRPLDVLHYAPEPSLAAALRQAAGVRYVSIDLQSSLADRSMDASALDFPAARFDLLICSHVLEHVDDDRQAMLEMHRVLRPDGEALLQHPIVAGQATFEDPSIIDPEERLRLFSQSDHVRVYGPDIRDRLNRAGFDVTTIPPEELASPGEFRACALGEPLSPTVRASDIYQCTHAR
jgi:SAM-dependent methyltransferase